MSGQPRGEDARNVVDGVRASRPRFFSFFSFFTFLLSLPIKDCPPGADRPKREREERKRRRKRSPNPRPLPLSLAFAPRTTAWRPRGGQRERKKQWSPLGGVGGEVARRHISSIARLSFSCCSPSDGRRRALSPPLPHTFFLSSRPAAASFFCVWPRERRENVCGHPFPVFAPLLARRR